MKDFKSSIFRALAILLLLVAAVLFCIAMVDTVYTTKEQAIQGYWIFLTGWLGFLFFQFAWFANPLTVLSLFLMRKKPWWALFSSGLALLCMSQAFLFYEIPADAKGNTIEIISRGTGFYCWIGMVACVFYSIIMILIYRAFKRDNTIAEDGPSSSLAPQYAAQNSINTAPLSYPSGAISTKTNP
jgi:hypothetical protein